jgi:acetylornithine aminotransferase
LKDIPFERIGAFVFEPGGSGVGFVRFPPKQLVQDIAHRIKQAGGLIVANEITTGIGRTGKWFGFQHYDIEPDIVALGKGLGNGYPVSAIAIKQNVAKKLEDSEFHYVQSHQNDPLGCAVAREVIAVMIEEKWIEKGNELGTYFLEGLKILQKKYAILKEARGRGMLLALEFHPHDSISVSGVYQALLEKGFIVRHYSEANILRFDPALNIEKVNITNLLDGIDSIMKAAG